MQPVIIIPMKNPGQLAERLISALQGQDPPVGRVIVIDSGSTDGAPQACRSVGFEVHEIDPSKFDHGGTRNLGVSLAGGAEIVVLMTQDALPASASAIAEVTAPFADESVGLSYGRQLPRPNANPIETHARLFNYPDIPTIRAMPGASALGVKAIFNSNSFAAYRVRALQQIGGFPERIIMGEDQVAAGRMLLAGWTLVYQPRATVTHSHGYSIVEEFKRYFDIGVFHEEQSILMAQFDRPFGEGRRFVRSESRHLAAHAPHLLPGAALRLAAKLVGYKLGHNHRWLPPSISQRLAMNSAYFRNR